MIPYLGVFLSYLLLYKYAALGLIVFFAGLILPLPVNTLLMAVGAFSAQGYFSFSLSLIVASVANILGDIVDYWVFRQYGHKVLREKYAQKYSYFVRLEEYVTRHPGPTIFVSRLVGILGPPVNFLCGYLSISFWNFLFFDTFGNVLYVLLFLTLGLFVGDTWMNVSGTASIVSGIVLVTILLGVVWFLYRGNKAKNK